MEHEQVECEADLDDVIQKLLTFRRKEKDSEKRRQSGQLNFFERFEPKQQLISAKDVKAICSSARNILLKQPPLLRLNPPLRVVGDIHGQYDDLLRIFEYNGYPPETDYLFLGDYVDRGPCGFEVMLLCLCYKLKYPSKFFILRGNHECSSIARIYGFYDECKKKYGGKLFKTFTEVFNCLPYAAIIQEKIFCIHGGLSPELQSIKQIESIKRPCEIPEYGLVCDFVWADPSNEVMSWAESDRGVSYIFGKKVVEKFIEKYDFDLIVRAHQVVQKGFEFFARRKLVTVFSAPNYMNEFDNSGAVLYVNEDLLCSFQILKGKGALQTVVGGSGQSSSGVTKGSEAKKQKI